MLEYSTDNVELLDLTEDEIEEVYGKLLSIVEEDLSRLRWLIRTWGYSWSLESPVSDSASLENTLHKIQMPKFYQPNINSYREMLFEV